MCFGMLETLAKNCWACLLIFTSGRGTWKRYLGVLLIFSQRPSEWVTKAGVLSAIPGPSSSFLCTQHNRESWSPSQSHISHKRKRGWGWDAELENIPKATPKDRLQFLTLILKIHVFGHTQKRKKKEKVLHHLLKKQPIRHFVTFES